MHLYKMDVIQNYFVIKLLHKATFTLIYILIVHVSVYILTYIFSI